MSNNPYQYQQQQQQQNQQQNQQQYQQHQQQYHNQQQQQQQQQNAWQQYYGSAQQQPYYPTPQPPGYPYSQTPQYYPQQPQHQQQSSSLCPPPPGYSPGYAAPTWNQQQQQQQYQQPQYNNNPAPPPPDSNKRQKIEQIFHCDTCNLTVDSSIALQAHVKSHITCTTCNDFTGSPKLVKAHYQAAHGKFAGRGFKQVTVAVPGLPVQRFRICVGDHPDDVKQWIADRRKKFPKKVVVKEKPPGLSLLDGYGSSSSSDNNAPKVVKQVEDSKSTTAVDGNATTNFKTRVCRYFARTGRCRNGDKCTFRHEAAGSTTTTNTGRSSLLKNRGGKAKPKTASTLLKKLLQTDADREATLTVQLLRYIVDCNYLQEQRADKDDAK